MITVARIALRGARVRIAALAVALGVFEYLIGLSYAAVDQNAIRELYESLPPALQALSGAADIASPAGYLGAGYLHPVALLTQGAAAISLGTAAAREIESGAAELFLSRPLSRRAWLAGHALATALAVAAVAAGGLAGGTVAALAVADLEPVPLERLAGVVALGGLLFLAVGAGALLAASLVRGGGRAVGWITGTVVAAYALNYLAQVWRRVEPLGPISPFHHYDPGTELAGAGVPAGSIVLLGGIAIAATALALWWIERRDIAP